MKHMMRTVLVLGLSLILCMPAVTRAAAEDHTSINIIQNEETSSVTETEFLDAVNEGRKEEEKFVLDQKLSEEAEKKADDEMTLSEHDERELHFIDQIDLNQVKEKWKDFSGLIGIGYKEVNTKTGTEISYVLLNKPLEIEKQSETADPSAKTDEKGNRPAEETSLPDTSEKKEGTEVSSETTETSETPSEKQDIQIDSSKAEEEEEEKTPVMRMMMASAKAVDHSGLSYSAHVENIGWQNSVSTGETAGTTGRALRVEAMQVSLPAELASRGGLEVRAHIENIGWMNPVCNGEIAGTIGRSLRMEAFSIKLTGELADTYDIFYRAHVQNIGWMDWTSNGADAGTMGYGLRVEAFQIDLHKKGDVNAEQTGDNAFMKQQVLYYRGHVQNIGWQEYTHSPYEAGTTGRGLRMEAVQIKLPDELAQEGGLSVSAHVQNIGWMAPVGNGQIAGTSGRSLRVEALMIHLTGDLSKKYDIYYRAHVENFGWLDWAKNGQPAGSQGYAYRVEALQIEIFQKNYPFVPYVSSRAFENGGGTPPVIEYDPSGDNNPIDGFYSYNGNTYYYRNGSLNKQPFTMEQTFYNVDEVTGAILSRQHTRDPKVYAEGIDVSEWNDFDLSDYKDGFVIIRAGWSITADKKAKRYMDQCDALGIPYGVYWYSYATDEEDAKEEADAFLNVIKGRNIRAGVWMDMENDKYKEKHGVTNADIISRICKTFVERVASHGYHTGIYSGYNYYNNYIKGLNGYDKWIAHYGAYNDGTWSRNLSGFCDIQQYTSKGPGGIGLDRNLMFRPITSFQ